MKTSEYTIFEVTEGNYKAEFRYLPGRASEAKIKFSEYPVDVRVAKAMIDAFLKVKFGETVSLNQKSPETTTQPTPEFDLEPETPPQASTDFSF